MTKKEDLIALIKDARPETDDMAAAEAAQTAIDMVGEDAPDGLLYMLAMEAVALDQAA